MNVLSIASCPHAKFSIPDIDPTTFSRALRNLFFDCSFVSREQATGKFFCGVRENVVRPLHVGPIKSGLCLTSVTHPVITSTYLQRGDFLEPSHFSDVVLQIGQDWPCPPSYTVLYNCCFGPDSFFESRTISSFIYSTVIHNKSVLHISHFCVCLRF